jgi:hypothetical protein
MRRRGAGEGGEQINLKPKEINSGKVLQTCQRKEETA